MWFEIALKGLVIGFVASIPLGPVGVVCIQRTLSKSQRSGFVSGMGAACADFIFAVVAAFFLSFVMALIEDYINFIKVTGGIIVIIIGVNIFLKNPVIQIRKNRANKSDLWSDFISVFFLTLANPAFIFMFIALFAGFGISSGDTDTIHSFILVGGVFLGGAMWWFTLSSLISLLRKKFRPRHLLVLNRVSGALIVLLGASAIMSLFIKLNIDNIIL